MSTKTNLIGARLLGYKLEHTDMCLKWMRGGGSCRCGVRPFSISNKADRMDVVEALGEKHGIYFEHEEDTGKWEVRSKRVLLRQADGKHKLPPFNTYPEATRAALESLAHIYLKEGEG